VAIRGKEHMCIAGIKPCVIVHVWGRIRKATSKSTYVIPGTNAMTRIKDCFTKHGKGDAMPNKRLNRRSLVESKVAKELRTIRLGVA